MSHLSKNLLSLLIAYSKRPHLAEQIDVSMSLLFTLFPVIQAAFLMSKYESDFFKPITLLFFHVQYEELKETIKSNFASIKMV